MTEIEMLEQVAKVLVGCGYALEWEYVDDVLTCGHEGYWYERVDPFAETRQGKSQLKALRKWCKSYMRNDWYESVTEIRPLHNLKAIKKARVWWCLERVVL